MSFLDNNFETLVLTFACINLVLFVIYIKNYIQYQVEENEFQVQLMIENIRAKERKRLINIASSELHDNISQLLSLALMNIKSIEIDTKFKSKENAIKLLQQSLTEIRFLNTRIKMQENTDIVLEKQTSNLIELLNKSSKIEFKKIGKLPQLKKDFNHILFRVLQELLSNIIRHSEATKVQLELSSENYIEVIHDGISFVPNEEDCGKGFGLGNMEENAKILGLKIIYNSKNPKIEIKLPSTLFLQKQA